MCCADFHLSAEKTHPLVPGVVTVCDVSDGPSGVKTFGMLYQCPVRQKAPLGD